MTWQPVNAPRCGGRCAEACACRIIMSEKRFSYKLVGPASDFVLKPGLNVVGRYLYCQVHIDAEDVSGEHAAIEVDDEGGVYIA
ncbi:MAG TPA: FHA domain-containing protein, partial [Planctomycetes bacterium]|nr:FHA domain-containing protein [Planctomycetota bacterium]